MQRVTNNPKILPKAFAKGKQKLEGSALLSSWWVFLFIAICYLFWSHGMQKKNIEYAELKNRLIGLNQEKILKLQKKEDLLLQIHSQSDPSWIQMVLMKGLGLVPEGQKKVYFKKEE